MTTTDAALLANAKRWMGKLPRDQFDMLLALVLYARKSEHAIGFRAGQAHANAGLLEALEFYADPEMWTPHRDAHSPIDMDDGKIARAAIAAAKGAAE
jgi:hypothetical protein